MKTNNLNVLLICLLLTFNINMFAQLKTPRGSQQATVSQRIGITDVHVKYSRPSVNDREIWGKLVPYGMNNLGFGTAKESPWRAGADENTIIKFTDDVKIEGQLLKAGKYGFHIIVNENDTATLIFSKDYKAWGSYFYEPSKDALRVDITTKSILHTELLTYGFENVKANSTIASLNWEKKQFPFKIEVDVANIVMDNFREEFKGQGGFQRQNWEQAANFSLKNGGNLEEALGWIDSAISGQFFSQKTYNNLQIKSQILSKLEKHEEASSVMDEALGLATILQAHRYGRTLIGKGEKEKALEVFKMNAKKNKDIWPVNYGLARAYSALGNYEKAKKYLNYALVNAPNEASKKAVQANIDKLIKGEDIN